MNLYRNPSSLRVSSSCRESFCCFECVCVYVFVYMYILQPIAGIHCKGVRQKLGNEHHRISSPPQEAHCPGADNMQTTPSPRHSKTLSKQNATN